jgi:hypothetical protein
MEEPDTDTDRQGQGHTDRRNHRKHIGMTDTMNSVTKSIPGRSGRTIFGFMAFAVLFSVIGAEIRTVQAAASTTALHNPTTPAPNPGGLLYEPPLIFLGGTVATAILVLMADTGETGRTLGVGLAGITLAAAVLVNGGPVWTLINKLVSSKPTTPLSGTTATAPTTTSTTTNPTGALA